MFHLRCLTGFWLCICNVKFEFPSFRFYKISVQEWIFDVKNWLLCSLNNVGNIIVPFCDRGQFLFEQAEFTFVVHFSFNWSLWMGTSETYSSTVGNEKFVTCGSSCRRNSIINFKTISSYLIYWPWFIE